MFEAEREREAGAWEKTGIERFFEFALERIHSDMQSLAKQKNRLSELELISRQEAIEDGIDYIHRLISVLLQRRGTLTPNEFSHKLQSVPELEEGFDFGAWWDYIMAHIQPIYESLDAMMMLVTGQPYEEVWGDKRYHEAFSKAVLRVYEQRQKELGKEELDEEE